METTTIDANKIFKENHTLIVECNVGRKFTIRLKIFEFLVRIAVFILGTKVNFNFEKE